MYTCNYCPKAFEKQNGLALHIRQIHRNDLNSVNRKLTVEKVSNALSVIVGDGEVLLKELRNEREDLVNKLSIIDARIQLILSIQQVCYPNTLVEKVKEVSKSE